MGYYVKLMDLSKICKDFHPFKINLQIHGFFIGIMDLRIFAANPPPVDVCIDFLLSDFFEVVSSK